MDPSALLAELVLQAEIAQAVQEVDKELERLVQPAPVQRRGRAQTREAEEVVKSWMRV